ncbi:MAG: molybdenum cofactor biosynthesis protein MoaE [Candidatus Methanofastidiosa archaeon]|nr:molybdenum cofactor biosynthesis protein MoaE [Candidatus Methanofastidiosa archaeon]MDD4280754.1 molybdenum cofactor biosynthesis protein MoaE [Candidatus Methanofastidiosa archaeon]
MIRIQTEDISLDEHVQRMKRDDCGALALFVGTVKNPAYGAAVSALELEAYEDMAYRELTAIEHEAREQWGLADVLVIHRVGLLRPGDRIVVIIAVAEERSAACDGMRYILEELKRRVPLFKKEHTDASSYWHGE